MLLYMPILYILGYVILGSKTVRNRAASAWHYAFGIAPFVGAAIAVTMVIVSTIGIILVFFVCVQIGQRDYEVVGLTLQIIGAPLLILTIFYTVIMSSVVSAITGIKSAAGVENVDPKTGRRSTPPPNIDELKMLAFGFDRISDFIKALFFPTDEMKKMFKQGKSIVSSAAEGIAFHLYLLGRNILFILYIVFCGSLAAYFIPEATDYKLVALLLAGVFFVTYWMLISSDPKNFEKIVYKWSRVFGKPVIVIAVALIYVPPATDMLKNNAQATFVAMERKAQQMDSDQARTIGGKNYDQVVFVTSDIATIYRPDANGAMSGRSVVIGKKITLWLAATHQVNGEPTRTLTSADGRVFKPVWWKKRGLREPDTQHVYWYPDTQFSTIPRDSVAIAIDYPAP